MLQKAIVLGLSILCLSVWSLVIIQLYKESPQVRASEASMRISALSHLQQHVQAGTSDYYYDLTEKYSGEQDVKSDSIQTKGITKEDMLAIAEDQSVSIDTLLYALNINETVNEKTP